MLLRGDDGSELELVPVGYGIGTASGDRYDDNWLIMRMHAKGPKGSWSREHPFLLTYEARQLGEWLIHQAQSTAVDPEVDSIDFLEPNLQLRIPAATEATLTIRVYFGLECRPPWSRSPTEEEIYLDLKVNRAAIEAAGRAFLSELMRFPDR